MAFAKGTVSLAQAGTDVFLASLNIPDLCPFITGVASFRYEIDILSLPLVGVRRNRRTIRSVSTTVTLALYSMSRRSEGLSGQATHSALTVS